MQSRATAETKETSALRQQVTLTKVKLALAKKTQQRAMAPHGRPGALREKPAALPPPRSADEANDRMFAQIERDYGAA